MQRAEIRRRFEANLSLPIHRLPDEVLAHVFSLGRPILDHTRIALDREHLASIYQPYRYQALVTSVEADRTKHATVVDLLSL
jgi:hypothetical protein